MLENRPMKIAILDDYQNVALKMADWTALAARAEITVFNDHLADVEELVERLCAVRQRRIVLGTANESSEGEPILVHSWCTISCK